MRAGIRAGLALVAMAGFAWSNPAMAQDAMRVPISRMAPAYPQLARQMKVFGTVKVQVTVLKNGNVSAAKAVDGHPLLRHEAEACVLLWRFMPGARVSTFVVPVEFELGE